MRKNTASGSHSTGAWISARSGKLRAEVGSVGPYAAVIANAPPHQARYAKWGQVARRRHPCGQRDRGPQDRARRAPHH